MAAFKRARSPAIVSPSSSTSSSPTLKAARTSATPPPHASGEPSTSSSGHILCTLPPTCNPPHRPTTLSGTRELEAHYAMYHAHVCEQKGCGCVFPDARLLELHQTECHDPLAAVRKERGEKIFMCLVSDCETRFSTPKGRRLHLIQTHGYPKEYFFAVTNKGVGGLLKKWGEGVSLVRKPWKARADTADGHEDEDEDNETADVADQRIAQDAEEDDEEEILFEKIQIERPPKAHHDHDHTAPTQSQPQPHAGARRKGSKTAGKEKSKAASGDVDALTGALDSLSLVPTAIQFGRGAKRGALQGSRGYSRRGGDRPGHLDAGESMDLDQAVPPHVQTRGRGLTRGGRGVPPVPPRGGALRGVFRGRGRGVHVDAFRGGLPVTGEGGGTNAGRTRVVK
ncbi:hypothetical protein C8Q80DRAFT_1242130 [Daedaleopsis nitida]|nr:hypothetical protein C8Q80DRAFT_1242130 [Daedaleopsis nitida]